MRKRLLVLSLILSPSIPLFAGASYYPQQLDDAKAVYLSPRDFSVHADGIADDTDAIQQAIDKEQETNSEGVVFIPSGKYRLTKTIHIWPGIRLIGYGATRPVLVVAPNTPYFQKGPAYMVFFTGNRPANGSNAESEIH